MLVDRDSDFIWCKRLDRGSFVHRVIGMGLEMMWLWAGMFFQMVKKGFSYIRVTFGLVSGLPSEGV